jgi:thiosulfate dehydrogenase [quinone] large subunit
MATTERETHKVFSDIVKHNSLDTTTDATTRRHPTAIAITAGITRLALGWVFLWAFLDKTFGLGHATPSEAAWIDGGSPTEGFLANAPTGPFESFYKDIAGAGWADWLFMIGLAGIGVALILGVFVNIAAASGALMLFLMWTAVLPPENNPFMDDHLIYGMVLVLLALLGAGRYLGLGAYWERLPFVKRSALLR